MTVRASALALAALCLAPACTDRTARPETVAQGVKEPLNMGEQRLWDLIDAAVAALPFTRENVEELTATALNETSRTPFFVRYEAKRMSENRFGVALAQMDLRTPLADPKEQGLLVLDLEPGQFTRAQVVARYPQGELTPVRPGGPKLELPPGAQEAYWVTQPWGRLAFGFRWQEPEKLVRVSFHPDKKS